MKTILILILAANSLLDTMGQTDSFAVNVSSETLSIGKADILGRTIGENMTEGQGKANALLLQDFREVEDPDVAIPDESFEDAGVRIFPTKTPDFLNVIISESVKENLAGEFIDRSGKSVKQLVLDALHNEISIKDLNYGVYLLKISSVNKRLTEVIITKDISIQP